MITAVDTSVLLDLFLDDPTHGAASEAALARCGAEGDLVVGDVVLAELSAVFANPMTAKAELAALGIEFSPSSEAVALEAGRAWRDYRAGGGSRTRIVADFLIGAHAVWQAGRLLTRDAGFHRKYFSRLVVIEPKRRTS